MFLPCVQADDLCDTDKHVLCDMLVSHLIEASIHMNMWDTILHDAHTHCTCPTRNNTPSTAAVLNLEQFVLPLALAYFRASCLDSGYFTVTELILGQAIKNYVDYFS